LKEVARRSPSRLSAATDLRRLLLSWLTARTEATQKTYRRDLADFAAFYAQLAKPTEQDVGAVLVDLFSKSAPEVTAIVLDYRTDLLSRPVWNSRRSREAGLAPDREGLAPSTVNRRLSALKSISKLARATGKFSGSIEVEGVKRRAYRNTLGTSEEGYHRLVEALDGKVVQFRDTEGGYDWAKYPRAVRDLAILRLLHDACLRRVEVVRLRTIDVVVEHRAIVLQPKGPVGDTEEWELGDDPWTALTRWLRVRGPEEGALFHGIGRSPTQHMDVSTVNKLIRARGDELGLRVRPHDLRHGGITTALDRTNGNVRAVQKLSRHKNIETVMVYDDRRRGVARGLQDLISKKTEE
jgi:integrase/recombinase XerC